MLKKNLKNIVGKTLDPPNKYSANEGPNRRKILFEALESRVLLSADLAIDPQHLQMPPDLSPGVVSPIVECEGHFGEPEFQATDGAKTDAPSTAIDTDAEISGPKSEPSYAAHLMSQQAIQEIVFIDPSVPDYASLLEKFAHRSPDKDDAILNQPDNSSAVRESGKTLSNEEIEEAGEDNSSLLTENIDPSPAHPAASSESGNNEPRIEIVVLDPNRDGIDQISEALADYQGISAVHIISHGAVGRLRLGNTQIDIDTLKQKTFELGTWKKSMQPGGDILLYGCNVAEGETGIAFVKDLSEMTGADVAASADATGGSDLGGDWVLEYTTGVIEAGPLFADSNSIPTDYAFLLDSITVDGTAANDTIILNTGVVTGGAASPQLVNSGDDLEINGLGGNDTFIVSAYPATASTTIDGGDETDTLDFSGVSSPLMFAFTPTTVTVTDNAPTPNSLSATNVEDLIGGSGDDTLDFSGLEDHLVFVIRQNGDVTITDGDYTVNADGTVSVSGGTGILIASNIENIVGGGGSNTFVFEDGATLPGIITGGAGATNTLDYSAYTSGVSVDLSTGSAEGTSGVANIQNIIGGSENDILIGDEDPNTIDGGRGTDTLVGGGGTDTIFISTLEEASGTGVDAGSESDILDVSDEASDLTFAFAALNNLDVSDNAGTPNIVTAENVEILFAGSGNDTLDLSSIFNDLTLIIHNYGGVTVTDGDYTVNADGTVSVSGGTGAVTVMDVENIIGGQGTNTYVFEDRAYLSGTIDGGSGGADVLDYSAYTRGIHVDLLAGTATGTSGISNIRRVTGGAGNDIIHGSAGDDILDGGAGTDTIDYSGAAGNVTVDLRETTAQNTVNAGMDTLSNFENIIGSPFADTLIGDDHANILDGSGGNDTLIGAAGNDTYTFGQDWGSDTIVEDPGQGSDTVDLSRVSADLVFTIHTNGTVSVVGSADSVNNADGIENLVGGKGNNTFAFEDGAVLDGMIDGGAGPSNTLDYTRYNTGVSVDLGARTAQGTLGISNIRHVIGGSGNDILTGDDQSNIIDGGPGSDNIDGGGGNDTVDYNTAPVGVNVNLSTHTASVGIDTDTLNNIENIVGSPFNDTLTGDDQSNIIDGGPGNDTLVGGAGNDTYRVTGHWGNDLITEQTGGGTDALVIIGSPDNDVFSVWADRVVHGTPGTDIVTYGTNIESLNIDAGEGETDQIFFAQTLIFDSAASFEAEDILFSQDIFAAGGITAIAEASITVASNVTLSTRQVSGLDHLDGISSGNSGNIDFDAPSIQISTGATLLAHVEEGSSFTPGTITLTAAAGSDPLGDLIRFEDISSKIVLSGATIKGGTVKIEAKADTDTKFDDIEDAGDAASFVLEAIGQFSVIGGWSVSKALAEIDIQSGTFIEAVDVEISADAKTQAKVMTLYTGLGVSYGESDPKARVVVQDGATITTSGDLDITTKADSTMSISAYALNLGPQRGKKWDLTAAVSKADIESTAHVYSGATLHVGGDLLVQADTVKNHSTSALGGAYADGNLGAGVAVSLCTSNTNAFVDGTVMADGDVRIAAVSDIPKNDISASAVSGSGMVAGLMLKIPNAGLNKIREWTDKRLPKSESKSKLGIAAAVAYADDTNNANARIGDNAMVRSQHGSIEIKASIADVPEMSANATVDSTGMASEHAKKNALATAIVIGSFNNHADAHIGSYATVIADDVILVNSDASIPYEANWGEMEDTGDINDYLNSNLGIQNGFVTTWARSAATVDDIGIAGSINVTNFNNTSNAFIAENATVLQNTLQFSPSEIVVDGEGKGKIWLGPGHGLTNDQQVTYNNGGGSDLGSLANGGTYYVLFDESDPEYIQLASTLGGEALALDTAGVTGDKHLLYKTTIEQQEEFQADPSENGAAFDPTGMTGQSEEIVFASDHHFYDGQEVVYNNGIEHILNVYAYLDRTNHAFFVGANHGLSNGDAVVYQVDAGVGVAGLTNGNTYYVVEATETQIKLANTPGGPAIEMDFVNGTPFFAQFTSIRLELKDLNGLVNGETYYVKYVDATRIQLASQLNGNAIQLDFDQAKGIEHKLRSKYAVHLGTNSFDTGEAILYTNGGGSNIAGLENESVYYVIKAGDNHIMLAKDRDDALNGIAIGIDTSGMLGTSHTFSSVNGVIVSGTSTIETVNFAGIYGLNPKRFFMSGADTAGVGVSYLDISYTSNATAEIKDGALVSGGSLVIDANTGSNDISIAISGGKAKKYGASGSISYLTVDNDTLAHISEGSVIVAQDIRVPNTEASLVVDAYDHSKIFNITGGVLLGANIGIGASVAIDTITRDTLAVVGNLEQVEPGNGSLFTPGNILVSAVNEGKITSISVAAMLAFQSKTSDPGVPNHVVTPEKTGKFGLHVSADVSLNTITDTAKASIRDANIRNAGDVILYAKNDSDIFAIAGSVAFSYSGKEGTSIGLAGAYCRNVVDDTTEAFIEGSTLSALGSLSMTTLTTGDIFSVTASGSGEVRDKGVAIAGSVSMNKIENITQTYIDSTTIQAVGNMTLAATDDSKINADAGGVALAVGKSSDETGAGIAVGASLAWNDMANQVRSYLDSSTVSASGNVALAATSMSTIDALTIGGAIAVGASGQKSGFAAGGAGAGSYNDIDNTIETYIKGAGTVTSTGGSLTLAATDVSKINADGGGVAVAVGASGQSTGGAISVGVSVADNDITNEVRSYISGSTITFAGDIDLIAISASKIDALTIGGAVAVGASGQGTGLAGAGAGAGSYNDVQNIIEAYIQGVGSVTSTGGDLKLTAVDGLPLFETPGLMVGDYQNDGQLPAAWRAVFTANGIALSNDVTVIVRADGREWLVKDNDNGDTYLIIKEQDNFRVLTPTAITADGGGVAVAVGASGQKTAGALSIGASRSENTISNKILAYIDNSAVLDPENTSATAAGNVALSAASMAEIDSLTIGGAIAVGASGSGSGFAGGGAGAASYNDINNTIASYIKGVGSITSTAGDLTLTATDNASIIADAVGGSIAVGASGSSTGGALSVGVSIAHNKIANTAQAYIDNSTLSTPNNTIVLNSGGAVLSAVSMATIKALSIAATIGVGAGSETGIALSGGGSESTNVILTHTNAYVLGSNLISMGDVFLDARNTSSITAKVITGSLSAGAGGTTGVAASVGASLARNLIGSDEDGNYKPAQVQAYVKNSSIATQGDLSQTALANETIDAVVVAGSVAISGAGTTGVGLSGSGADGKNKIATQIKAFIEGDGSTGIVADSVTLTAQDTSKITADVVGGSLAGAFAGEVGVSLSIGVALAYNEIRNDIATFMKNGVSPVETLTGGITLYAGETATIKALSIAASASIAIAGTSGIALSGAGAETTNVILTGTNAYVEGSNLISAGDVVLYAGNTSTITAKIITGSVSAGIGGTAGVGASIGASLARNLIGWDTNGIYMPAQVQAYVRNSSIDAEGDLTQTAVADETIDAIVVAGSVAISGGTVGVGLSGSGADAENKISTLVKAFIEKETNYSGPTPIVADSVTLTALDISDIKADVGAGSLAASFAGTAAVSLSIGVALAENAINNVVQAYITNADSVTATDGAVTLQAIESATVDALSIAASLAASFGSVGVALSGAGAEATNTIGNSVNAVITDSSVTTSPSPFDYTTQHRPATIEQGDRVRLDDGDIYEYVSETGLSGPVDLSTLDYSDVTQWKRIANDIIVAAQSFSTITAMVGGVSAAVSGGSVAASGSIGVSTLENTVLNQIAAYIEDSTVSSADDITIGAKAMETVDAVSFSGSLAIAAGPGGALAGCGAEVTNTFMSGVQAYLQDTVAKAVDDIDVTAVSDSEVKKSQAIGVAVAGSLGAASVAASLVDNQISNTVQAYVISPYDYTLQDQPNEISQGDRIKLDSGDIYEYVDAAPLTGPVDLSTQNYADTTQWKQVTTSLEAGGDIAVSADVARARMSDVTATTASVTVGVVGLSGGGIDIENTITNNVGAFIGGPVNVEADGDVDVTASEDAYILGDATAVSVSASLGAGLGVALVENQIGSTIQAWVHEATITSENTRVLADSVADVAKTVSAGVSGSAILGAQGNEANAIINTLVKAYTADATLISSGDITISATANNTANTSAKGGAFGAIAVGAMIADVNLGRDYIDGQDVYHNVYEVEAAIDTGTTVNARTLRITASSTDDLLSDSTAGGGGAVAAAGAESKVTSNNATLARIGSGAHIEVNGLAMNSTHVQDVDASADSYAFAAAAGSGAGVDNTITSKANVDIGAGAFVTAKNIVINAKNQLTKDDFKDSSNLRSGSASLGNITVLLSETSIGTESSPFEAVVNIGAGANLTVEGDNQNPGTFKIEALNDVFAVDSVRIESVSGFGVSTGISRVEANTLAAINVNAATLESKAGDVYLTAKTDSSVNPSANLLVITALTGGAGAEATASTKAINAININNSTVKGADLYMYAGRDSSEVPNVLNSYANTELTAVSMFPNIAVPVPTADIDEINVVNILGASTIRALEDVNLVADEGIGGKDRVTAEGLALSLSLIPYGFPIPGYGGVDSTNSVIIDNQARIEAGINNQAVMLIKPVTLMGEQNIDPSRLDMPLADRILTDAEKLEEGISFVSVTNQDIINVVAGANKGGVVGNRYAYIGDPAELVLSEQDYTDTGKWTDVTAATTDADATYDSDFVTDVQYEYCELNVDEIAFNVSTGTVIQVAADSNGDPVAGAGDINALYRYTPQIDEPVGIVLHKENYNDETKWEKLVPAYDLNTPPPGPVNIEPGQIVRTTEDVLYEYLGASVANVDLSTENFGDIEKWGELAPTIYKSDVAVSFKASLENKFYVVKPTRLETPTMSLENVGSLLLAQRERILGWIANHGTNAEAIARYEIQLAVVEETLTELGLMDTFVDPDTGETAQVANEGLDVLFIELPDIYAAPGSIFIKADATLRDTFVPLVDNQLVARVGAKINVFNETPFSMTVNDTVIRDTRRVTVVDGEYTVLTPGNVYFNYKGLTAVQDPPDKRITITQDSISRNGADYDLDLELPEAVGQDIYVMGDVINEVGDVTIINNEGSINVSGEIRAEDVEIRAAQDFNLNTEDWFHNMDPRQYPGLDTYRQEVFNTAGTLTTATYADNPFIGAIDPWSSSILAQGNIAVTAQYLNINGLIQSGVQTVTLYVDESFAPTSTTSLLDDDGRPLEGISFGADRVPVDGYFDAQKQAIVVDEIIPKGGNIVLTGQILSTGNGMLKAAYGYTSVDIQNESPYHLILNRIDTTKKREGKITIIDTARLQKVEYVVDGTEVRETIYQGAPSDDGSGISRIVYEEVESLPHGLTDTIEYRPREGIQYMWTEGQEKTRVVLTKYEKKSFNLFGTDSDWMVKDSSYKWQVTNFRDEYPLLESEVLAAEPDYDLETLPSGTLVTLEAGQIVKDTQGNVYRYQGATVTDFDLGTADYSDSSQWVPDIEVPSYADGEAYTIQYVMKNDTDVELVPNIDIVKVVADTNGVPFAKDGVVGHRYQYTAPDPAELVLRDQDYSDETKWTDVTNTTTDGQVTYLSSFENYTYKVQSWTTGGGWLRKKTVHTLTTQTFGEKDYYTHTLKADYPIEISFIQGPATPSINIDTKQDLLLQGTITTPEDGAITLTSGGDIIFGDTAAILGASPTISAGGSVRANVEGGKASNPTVAFGVMGAAGDPQVLSITSEHDIELRVVYDPDGNQSSTIVVGQIISTGGNVILHAGEGIQAFDSSSFIRGNQIELYTTEGAIGSADLPLLVDSDLLGSGGVAAKARGDIYIREIEGDLKLAQPQTWDDVEASIYSEEGDIYLHVDSGAILDAFYEEFRPRTQQEADELDAKQNLTGQKAREAAEESIRIEENDQTQLYHSYWETYRNAKPDEVAREIRIESVDAGNNELHFNQAHGLETGDQVFFSVGIDLSGEDYGDTSRWAEMVPNYDLGTVTGTVSLETDQIVKTADGVLYSYQGENASDVDLNNENYGDVSRWVKINPDYDLDKLAAGKRVMLETEQVVRTNDGLFYRYEGESVSKPQSNLENDLAYYVVVKDDTTIQLALSRYDAAISETPKVVDVRIEGDEDFNYASLLEYGYSYGDLQQDVSTLEERYQKIHETYGDGEYDPNFLYQISGQERQARIEARMFSPGALRYPVSRSLFSILYPDADGAQVQGPDTSEMPNIIGRNITLTGGAESAVGRMTGEVTVDLRNGYESLADEQKEILSIATVEDIVGISYGLYRYQGTTADLDLKDQDFNDGTLWQKLTPDFTTSTVTSPVQIANGQTVLVQSGAAYGLYRYEGTASAINLAKQVYADGDLWQRVTADFVTSDGEVLVAQGQLVENKGEIDTMTLAVWNDVDLVEPDRVSVSIGQGVALETAGDFKIDHIEAGGDVRIKAGGAITDLDAGGTAAIISGDLILVAENETAGNIGTLDNPVTLGLHEGATLTARAAQDIFISAVANLYLDTVQTENHVHLVAQDSIFDGIGDDVWNIRGGSISLRAVTGGIGSIDNDLDFDSQNSPSWTLDATAEQDIYLAVANGGFVIGDNIQVTSNTGDASMTVTDSKGPGDNLIVSSTKTDAILSIAGSVILRAGDNITVETGSTIGAAISVIIYGDYGNADPGTGSVMNFLSPIPSVPINVYGYSDDDLVTLTGVTYTGADPAPVWTIDGLDGSDQYLVNLTGMGKSEVKVLDTGAIGDDTLTINGTSAADTFLFRKDFVALLRPDGRDAQGKPKYHSDFERVWYDENINNQLIVNSGEGDDYFALDDNSAATTINTGAGKDRVQIGQMFKSGPTGVETVETTFGFLSNGVSVVTTINAGDGDDDISVYRNRAELYLNGEQGDDKFDVRAFAKETTTITGGDGADTIKYVVNAPVNINGGEGEDLLILIGTEFADDIAVTDKGVFGAGLTSDYNNVENLIVDAYIGDDKIFVLSTNPGVNTVLLGNYGSDTIYVGGVPIGIDLDDIIVTAEDVGFIVTNTLDLIAGPLRLEGGSGEGEGARPLGDPVQMPGEGEDDPSFGGDELIEQLDESLSHDTLNVYNTNSETDDEGWLDSTTLTGLNMSDGVTIAGREYPGGFVYHDMEEMNITLGSGSDIFNVRATHSGTTSLTTSGGSDTIHVSNLAPDIGGVVDQIAGLLTIDGGDNDDIINIDDTGDTDDNAGVLTNTRLTGLDMGQGIQYTHIEELNIDLGSGDDVFNIRGTSVTTNLDLHDGNDRIYVSSKADLDIHSSTDFLEGDLDNILGQLNIDAGQGKHLLMVSDSDSHEGDTDILITNALIHGLAPADISYKTDPVHGNFAGGITLWSGYGQDNFTVASTHKREGVRTITTLNTGLGDDSGTVSLEAGTDGFLVLNLQGPDNAVDLQTDNDSVDASLSSLPLIIFGGTGDDTIFGGSGDDLIFGDRGRVHYLNENAEVVAVLGGGGPGDTTDGIIREPGTAFSVDGFVGGNDTIDAGEGDNIVSGGFGDDGITTGDGNDVVMGDNGHIDYDTDGAVKFMATIDTDPSTGGDDGISVGSGINHIFGGMGNDQITTGDGTDIILGDNGLIAYEGITGNLKLKQISSTEASEGGNDTITTGNGDKIILGGFGDDTITSVTGNDIVIGDNGVIEFDSEGRPQKIMTANPEAGGSDVMDGGAGDDIMIGGPKGDKITGGSGDDILIGDGGMVTLRDGVLRAAETIDPFTGGNDFIDGGPDHDILIGGFGSDLFVGNFTDDIIVGEYARVTIEDGKVVSVVRLGQYSLDIIASTLFSLYASPFVLGWQEAGPATVGGILPGKGAGIQIMAPEAGAGGAGVSSLTSHHDSFAKEGYSRPEGYGEPEGYTVTEKAEEYTVKKGDTLWDIAEEKLGNPLLWPDIWHLNPEITNPDVIYPGQVIKVPIEKRGPDYRPESGELGDEKAQVTVEKEIKKDNEFGRNRTRMDSELGIVVAGLMGWGVASIRRPGDPSILDREAFRKLTREADNRRFLRWHDGQFREAGSWGRARIDEGDLPSSGILSLSFDDRRKCQ